MGQSVAHELTCYVGSTLLRRPPSRTHRAGLRRAPARACQSARQRFRTFNVPRFLLLTRSRAAFCHTLRLLSGIEHANFTLDNMLRQKFQRAGWLCDLSPYSSGGRVVYVALRLISFCPACILIDHERQNTGRLFSAWVGRLGRSVAHSVLAIALKVNGTILHAPGRPALDAARTHQSVARQSSLFFLPLLRGACFFAARPLFCFV